MPKLYLYLIIALLAIAASPFYAKTLFGIGEEAATPAVAMAEEAPADAYTLEYAKLDSFSVKEGSAVIRVTQDDVKDSNVVTLPASLKNVDVYWDFTDLTAQVEVESESLPLFVKVILTSAVVLAGVIVIACLLGEDD